MSTDVVGSKMPSNSAYGQNGSDTPSSIRPGESVKRSAVAKSIVAAAADPVTIPGSDWQTRNVDASPIKAHPATKGPSKGARVPLSNVRRATDGLLRRTR